MVSNLHALLSGFLHWLCCDCLKWLEFEDGEFCSNSLLATSIFKDATCNDIIISSFAWEKIDIVEIPENWCVSKAVPNRFKLSNRANARKGIPRKWFGKKNAISINLFFKKIFQFHCCIEIIKLLCTMNNSKTLTLTTKIQEFTACH